MKHSGPPKRPTGPPPNWRLTHNTMVINILLPLAIPLAIVACPKGPVSPDVVTDADAAPATCAAACEHMREPSMKCKLGEPTPKGASCETVCENVQRENAGQGFDTRCLVKATSCTAADACR